jgi:hypothetical protein
MQRFSLSHSVAFRNFFVVVLRRQPVALLGGGQPATGSRLAVGQHNTENFRELFLQPSVRRSLVVLSQSDLVVLLFFKVLRENEPWKGSKGTIKGKIKECKYSFVMAITLTCQNSRIAKIGSKLRQWTAIQFFVVFWRTCSILCGLNQVDISFCKARRLKEVVCQETFLYLLTQNNGPVRVPVLVLLREQLQDSEDSKDRRSNGVGAQRGTKRSRTTGEVSITYLKL